MIALERNTQARTDIIARRCLHNRVVGRRVASIASRESYE